MTVLLSFVWSKWGPKLFGPHCSSKYLLCFRFGITVKKKSQNFHFWINSLLLIKNHGSMEICISSLLNYRLFRSVYCILYCINRKSEARLDSILFLFPSGAVKLNSCSFWDDSCMTSSQFNFGIVCETKRKTYFNRHCSTTTVVQNRSSSICNIH